MIKLTDLNFAYDTQKIVNDVDFTFAANKIYAIVGPSGVGKSTLLELLAGFLSPNSGEIAYQGIQPAEVITVFQNNQLFPWLTVEAALTLPLTLKRAPDTEKHTRVVQLLRDLQLTELADQKTPALSGGQRQRVALGQGLATDPAVLLLDEPTSSLDQAAKEELQNLILREQQARENTMILVTHDIEEAAFLGQEILLLKNGQLHPIANPTFSLPERRNALAFYEFCITLRKQVRADAEK